MVRRRCYMFRALTIHCYVLVGCTGMFVVGCGHAEPEVMQINRNNPNMKRLGIEYGKFVVGNRNRPPKNEEQFRAFVESRKNRLGIDSIDPLFISVNDKQPLVVVCGNVPIKMAPDGFPWAAYEQTSTQGQRLAVSGRGTVCLLNEDEFQQAFP